MSAEKRLRPPATSTATVPGHHHRCIGRGPARRVQRRSSLCGVRADSGFDPTLDLSSLDGTNGFRLDGINPFSGTGRSVSGAGNVNGDGFDDVIVGASGEAPNGYGSGSAFVVFGRSTFSAVESLDNPDSDQVWRLNGGAEYDHAGRHVSSAGDVNGDGLDDVLIGASGEDSYTGAVYLVYGRMAPDSVLRVGTEASQTLAGSDLGDA